jgi:hypothetical protein
MRVMRWLLILPLMLVLARASSCPTCFLACRCAHGSVPKTERSEPAPSDCCARPESAPRPGVAAPTQPPASAPQPCATCTTCGELSQALPISAAKSTRHAGPTSLVSLLFLEAAPWTPLAPLRALAVRPTEPPGLCTLHVSIPTTVLRT